MIRMDDEHILDDFLSNSAGKDILIISPFITINLLDKLLSPKFDSKIEVITSWNERHILEGVSNLKIFDVCKKNGWKLRVLLGNQWVLHSKIYAVGEKILAGSANFTKAGLTNPPNGNFENLMEVSDYTMIRKLISQIRQHSLVPTEDLYQSLIDWMDENNQQLEEIKKLKNEAIKQFSNSQNYFDATNQKQHDNYLLQDIGPRIDDLEWGTYFRPGFEILRFGNVLDYFNSLENVEDSELKANDFFESLSKNYPEYTIRKGYYQGITKAIRRRIALELNSIIARNLPKFKGVTFRSIINDERANQNLHSGKICFEYSLECILSILRTDERDVIKAGIEYSSKQMSISVDRNGDIKEERPIGLNINYDDYVSDNEILSEIYQEFGLIFSIIRESPPGKPIGDCKIINATFWEPDLEIVEDLIQECEHSLDLFYENKKQILDKNYSSLPKASQGYQMILKQRHSGKKEEFSPGSRERPFCFYMTKKLVGFICEGTKS